MASNRCKKCRSKVVQKDAGFQFPNPYWYCPKCKTEVTEFVGKDHTSLDQAYAELAQAGNFDEYSEWALRGNLMWDELDMLDLDDDGDDGGDSGFF